MKNYFKINEWNYRIIGREQPVSYNGYKTKKEALAFVNDWNSIHQEIKLELVRLINNKWVVVE